MPGFEDLHLTAAAAVALERLGWEAADTLVRESAPTAARGHNLAMAVPHAAAYAGPALAALLGRLGGDSGARALMLVPASEVDEWGALAEQLAAGSPLRIQTAHGEARALRRLRARELDLLIAPAETAVSLAERSALKMDELAAIFVAWPESLDADEALTTLMQDLPREAQRIVCTAFPDRLTEFVERYARKAMTVGALPAEAAPAATAGPVRLVTVSWRERAAMVGRLIETLDPDSVTIWAADRSHAAGIAAAVPLSDRSISFVAGEGARADAPPAALIVAFDPPSPARLRQLLSAGDVVLLVPATADAYVTRVASPRRPLRVPGLADDVTRAAAGHRATIAHVIEESRPDRALLTLAPLFERYDAAAVAAALFELWRGGVSATTAATAPRVPETAATTRIFVGVGRNDNATANDFVAVLTKDLRVERGAIGRIELKDSFSLVEVPAGEAEKIAAGLNGVMIRKKRVTARVDRGPTRTAGRGGPRR